MPNRSDRHPARCRVAVVIAFGLSIARDTAAQQPTSPAAPGGYRPPTIALAQPVAGAAVPQDHAVVIFRFTQGEADDPIDARSFTVGVDGKDRSSSFQVAPDRAWGPLGDGSGAIAPGAHQLSARICSTRGICGAVDSPVLVNALGASPTTAVAEDRKRSFIDLLLIAVRKLIAP
jgi:hypothetical protein